ncbi:NitT/TauT family transport system substrate-binding protein [Enhydrobacter aerosaccus]|uniref:NitT/TauT family transport system substrate-binding protein n=1 Tax=Enhydrobacter aerosaccus TaxID=225324 RepID=A0A1T4PPB8_9HYPH|nr:ABC transporter substrate-binding protein [Enhydrobacter aerosaccus]SJZ93289.1 NitT/TauT family transport system substrate-binding protein [Enhydrobacter aerosaccus]
MFRFATRRTFLRTAAAASALIPAAAVAQRTFLRGQTLDQFDPSICRTSFGQPVILPQKRELKLTWNATAICTVGVAAAKEKGYFAKHNLDVELINFGGSTDQLLEAIATGKADAGIGMALRWLKPLEAGFDVKISAGIHGGCMRLFTTRDSGIHDVGGLKGKTIGVTDLAAPDRNFFSIMLQQAGVDPNKEIEWKVFPGDVLPVALKKGEVQAFALGDPLGWIARDRDNLFEIANNLTGDFSHRTCCVLGIRGSLIRQDKPVATALTQALLEAQEWVATNSEAAAEVFAPHAKAPVEQLAAMLRSHTHHHNPLAADLRQQISLYAEELKSIAVFKQSTDVQKYAARVTADVLA